MAGGKRFSSPGYRVFNDDALLVLMLEVTAYDLAIPGRDGGREIAFLDLASGPDHGFDDDFNRQSRTHRRQFGSKIPAVSGDNMTRRAGQGISMVDLRSMLGIAGCPDFDSERIDPLLAVGWHADGLAPVPGGRSKDPGKNGGVNPSRTQSSLEAGAESRGQVGLPQACR